MTFDHWSQNTRLDFLENGTYSIVQSSRISIDGEYGDIEGSRGWMTSLRVSGPFLQGHNLIFKAGSTSPEVSWDGRPILQESQSSISLESGLVHIARPDNLVDTWMRLEKKNNAPKIVKGQAIKSFHVSLPLGLELSVNVVRLSKGELPKWHIDLLVSMRPEPEGQSGHCGNFNGDASDDTLGQMAQEHSRRLEATSETETGCATDEDLESANIVCRDMCGGGVPSWIKNLNMVDQESLAGLKQAFIDGCIYDVCQAGPSLAVSDCFMGWESRVAAITTSASVSLVGPGCCKPAKIWDFGKQMSGRTLKECTVECASHIQCTAFAMSGCSGSSDEACLGTCHIYTIGLEEEITTGSCMDSNLNGNTFCYSMH